MQLFPVAFRLELLPPWTSNLAQLHTTSTLQTMNFSTHFSKRPVSSISCSHRSRSRRTKPGRDGAAVAIANHVHLPRPMPDDAAHGARVGGVHGAHAFVSPRSCGALAAIRARFLFLARWLTVPTMHPPSPSAPTTRHRTALAQLQSSIALGSQSKATAPAAASSAPASSLSAGAAASHSSSNPTAPLGKENRAATPSLLRGVSAKNARGTKHTHSSAGSRPAAASERADPPASVRFAFVCRDTYDSISRVCVYPAGTSLTSSLLPLVEDDDAPDSSEEAAAAGSSASASSLSLRGLFNPAFDAPSLPATNVGKTTHTNMGDMKERINAATLAGRAIARGAASPASALTTPQRSVNDENAIFAEERDLFAPRNTPATPAFTPMPLAARQTTPASFLGQRLTRDVVPTAGKLAELRTTGQRTSLFPSTAGSASSLTARGSAAGSSDAASMLHHGIDQVLSTKDSARRYIEGQWTQCERIQATLVAVLTRLACIVLFPQ